ncbi:MAG TPA: hypothetical protein VFC84_17240 [Desulfosporosinus sp.]|nr:hypothetical protein [Desulfosporosinus sp.]
MKERGSALLTAVIIVMVLLSISGILLTTVVYQAKNESSEERGLRAYYLAEAGVQYGIAAGITELTNAPEAEFTLTPPRVNNPFGQGGWFEVTVTRATGAISFTVNSSGDYLTTLRTKVAEYDYGVSTGGDVGGGSNCENTEKWVNNIQYQKDNEVCYNSKKFYARNNTGKNEEPGLINSPWQEITELWKDFNIYQKDDVVFYNGKPFYARNNTGKNEPPGLINSPWQEMTELWKDFNIYQKNDIVFYNGKPFKARNNTGKNEQPSLPTSPWDELTDQWRSFNFYNEGNIVLYTDGKRYRAKYNHSPSSTAPPNSSAWALTSSPLPKPFLLKISVTPIYASIQVGHTQAFVAKAVYSNDFTEVSNQAVWSQSNGSVVTLLGKNATGNSAGTSTITASFGGRSGTATLTVTVPTNSNPPLMPGNGKILWEKEIIN